MKKKDIIINADNKVLKNVSKKEHACLTTYDGLSDLAQYELNESLNFNLDAKIEEFDVYKYDLLLISLVNSILNELGYKIVKK